MAVDPAVELRSRFAADLRRHLESRVSDQSGRASGRIRQRDQRDPAAPPAAPRRWSADKIKQWELLWGDDSGSAPADGPDGQRGFPSHAIVVPPAESPDEAPAPKPKPDREYATADEEWDVAKQSAWNWLVDKVTFTNPLAKPLLSSWRYSEPDEHALRGREYELRQSYEAMQNFLSVTEFAVGFVTPAIVETAVSTGLPSRFTSFMRALAADETGMAAFGVSVQEVKHARQLLEQHTGKRASEASIRQLIQMQKAYAEERQAMKIDGRNFESFKEHIFPGGDVNIGWLRGNRQEDFAAANKLAGLDTVPDGWVWHHHPDFGRLVLVPRDVHNKVHHWGGVAIWKRVFGVDYP